MFRPLGATRLTAALLLLAAGCATGAGGGLPDDPVLRPYEPKRWVGTPKSGLRIIVQEDHSSPLVHIVTTYGAGATSDPKGVEGMAHFLEHLVFRSKPFGGDTQYWDLLKRMGGDFNASTSWDYTNYYTTAHKDQLEMLLRLEAWRLMNTVGGVTPEVFNLEREVVRNELRQRWETTAGNKMFDLLFDSLYPAGHPLRTPVGGTHESLTAAKLEHAQAFVKQHYRPDNTVITIVGAVTVQQVKDLLGTWPAELLFGPGGPQGPAVEPRKRLGERPAPPVPPPVNTKLVRYKGPIDRPVLLLAWSLPPGLRGKDAIASFAARRLSAAVGRLDRKLEDDIMGAGADTMALADSSIMYMQAALRPWADPERARQRLLDILVYSWADQAVDISEQSSVRIDRMSTEMTRWFSATALLLGAAEPRSTASQLSWFMAATGKHNYFQDQLEELAKVNASDVSDFARQWLTRERAVAVYFEPESDRIPLVAGGGGGGGAAGGDSGRHDIGRGMNVNAADLTAEKLAQVIKSPELGKIPRFTSSNGLDVYVIERPESPVVNIQVGMRGGNASVKPVGAASLADSMAQPKCRQYKDLTEVGGFAGGGVGLNSSSMSAEALSGNLNNALAAVRDNLSCVEVSEEAFLVLDMRLTQQAKLFDRQAVYPDFVARKWMAEQLYPGHPYGEAGFVNPLQLKNMTRDNAQGFVSSLYQPGNAVAVVYGGVTMAEVKSGAEQYLASWRGGTGGASLSVPPAPEGPTARQIRLVNRDQATQAVVTIGCRLAPVTPETIPAYDVLESVANESAWALREQYGATYGVRGGVRRNPDRSASFTIGGAIENRQAGASIARLLKVLEAVGQGTIAEPLFLTKRWDVGREFMIGFATADARAGALIGAKLSGIPLEAYDNYPQNLGKVSRETLKQIMVPCLGKEIIAIVGDAAVLKPQLEAAGLKVSN